MILRCAHPTRRVRRAYTLVELLIVIAILGIAGALLVPNIVNRDVMLAEAAVRQLISDLSYAQSDALAHQELRRIWFYDDGRGYCIYRVTQATFGDDFDPDTADYIADPLASAGNVGSYIVDYAADGRWEGVRIGEVDLDGGERFITYDELGGVITTGMAPSTGGTIVLAYDGASYEITIAPFTGKITVAKLS